MIRKSRAIQALKISETLLMYEIHGKVHDQIQERPQTRKKQGKDIDELFRVVECLANGE